MAEGILLPPLLRYVHSDSIGSRIPSSFLLLRDVLHNVRSSYLSSSLDERPGVDRGGLKD